MLSDMSFFLFFLINFPLFPFFRKTSSCPSLSKSPFVLEYWLIINVLQFGDCCDKRFSVVRDFLIEPITLKINHCNILHLPNNLVNKLRSINFVALNIKTRDTGTLQQSYQVIKPFNSNSIVFQHQILQPYQRLQPFDLADVVLTEIEVADLREGFESLDFSDHVLLEIETPHVGEKLKILNFGDTVSLEIQNLQTWITRGEYQ